jgi:hypothetical protein
MRNGRIKVVANVQKTTTYAAVMAFMEDNIEELGTQRVAAKMSPDFQGFSIPETKMKVIQNGPDLWQLYPKIVWQGELKPSRDIHQIQQDACDDLAAAFQSVLESDGYTVLSMYIQAHV